MPPKNQVIIRAPKKPEHATAADTTRAVDDLMASLEHPAKAVIQSLRAVILGADPSVREGVKWNAPSFRTTEYFATMNLRAKQGVVVVLHFGAKVRDVGAGPATIEDPGGLLKWLAKDRATVTFEDASDLRSKKSSFQAVLRQWIEHV